MGPDISLGGEELCCRRVVRFDPFSVSLQWLPAAFQKSDILLPEIAQEEKALPVGSAVAHLVQGSPFATMVYNQVTPKIYAHTGIRSVDEALPGSTLSGNRFLLRLNSGIDWLLYFVPRSNEDTLSFSFTEHELVFKQKIEGALRIVKVGDNPNAFDTVYRTIVTGGKLGWTVSSDGQSVEEKIQWTCVGDPSRLFHLCLPHQADWLSLDEKTTTEFQTIKGPMKEVMGDVWLMKKPLPALWWHLLSDPSPTDASQIATVLISELSDTRKDCIPGDCYFGGKRIARLAQLLLIANHINLAGSAIEGGYDLLYQQLKTFLEGRRGLVFDSTWGGVMSHAAWSDHGAEFGQGLYNDHHYHWGYIIFAASVLAKRRGLSTLEQPVMALVRDIASLEAGNSFPQARHFDFFQGHSWASGLSVFADAKNQESTSEAVNAYYAVALLGDAINDWKLRDWGRFLAGNEICSAQKYWQILPPSDSATSIHYGPPYDSNGCVGVLWSTKVDYATWFGAKDEYIHGIQMLPFTPISEVLLQKKWVAYTLAHSPLAGRVSAPDVEPGWKGFLLMAKALVDPEAAWKEAQEVKEFDNGNSRTNLLYWISCHKPHQA